MDEKHVEGDLVNVLYTEEQIQNRLAEPAAIERDYEGKEICSSASSRARSW